MNRTRCPWCGKRIDKGKDKIYFHDVYSPTVPRFLRKANCHHCRHKYGQVPLLPYVLKTSLAVLVLVVLAFVFQSVFLLVCTLAPCLLLLFTPYSKLNDEGKQCETNTDSLCEFVIMDEYEKLKSNELYFLEDDFDDFEPFLLASPILIHYVSKKANTVLGEFIYMHEKNYDYINKDLCNLYDTNMNLIAKIKFRET